MYMPKFIKKNINQLNINRLNKWRGKKIYRTEPTSDGNTEWCWCHLFFIKASEKGLLCIWSDPAIGKMGWSVLLGQEWIDNKWRLSENVKHLGIPLMD